MENLTKNNSNEMKTVVETFVIEETVELIYDNDKLDQWNGLVQELGLTGQESIIQKEKSPIPFMHMNQSLKNVFETLLPRKVEVYHYDITPIPVEILSLVSLSKKEEYFDKIQIWYDDKSADPACIGLRYKNESDRKNGYTWNMEHYLLGKWADVKHSFEELKERAVIRWKQNKKIELQQSIKNCQRQLEDLEEIAHREFGQINLLF